MSKVTPPWRDEEITFAQAKLIKAIEDKLGIEFKGQNKGEAYDFISAHKQEYYHERDKDAIEDKVTKTQLKRAIEERESNEFDSAFMALITSKKNKQGKIDYEIDFEERKLSFIAMTNVFIQIYNRLANSFAFDTVEMAPINENEEALKFMVFISSLMDRWQNDSKLKPAFDKLFEEAFEKEIK